MFIFIHHFSPCPSVTANDNSGSKVIHFESHISHQRHVHHHDWQAVVFSRIFWWQNDFHEEFSFRLWKSLIYSFILWFLCTNVERFGREKIVQLFSAILNLESCHVASKCLVRFRSPRSKIKNVIGVAQMDCVWLYSSKLHQKKTKKNIIDLIYHRTDRTSNSLHQIL